LITIRMSENNATEHTQKLACMIQRHLPNAPATALDLLPQVACAETRCRLARLIANAWARSNINQAWNAVSAAPLPAADKQVLFNELWS
jgi:hypothetical protein